MFWKSVKDSIKSYIDDVIFVKDYIYTALIIIGIIFVCVLWFSDDPHKTTFTCSKTKNICTLAHGNILKERKENIEFNKILRSDVEDGIGSKEVRRSRNQWVSRDYFYYEWILFYNDNGKLDRMSIFKSSDYNYRPTDKSFDRQYKYYNDTKNLFNTFLKDETKTYFYIPNFVSDDVVYSYWEGIGMYTFWWASSIYMLFLLITAISAYIEMFKQGIK